MHYQATTETPAMGTETIPQVSRNVLGVAVRDMSYEDALAHLLGMIDARTHCPVAFLNAHNANIACEDAEFHNVLRRFTVLTDGIGIDLAGLVLHGTPFRANLNGTDFVPALISAANRPLRIGLFGARPGVAVKAAVAFAGIDDRHDYRALAHGYIDKAETDTLLAELVEWRPDILLVALGVPAQEKWIAANITPAHCTIPMAVGALFDLTTGTVSRAPRWMRRLRCEWIYRLALEPRRLSRRYLIGNPVFLWRVLRQRVGSGRASGRAGD